MANIQKAAQIGFSSQAHTYAKGRPNYPSELSAWLEQELDLLPGSAVIDLGAGTGKFTRLLKSMALDVIAVEPVEAMRAEFAQSLPDVRIVEGTADSIPFESGMAQAVVCAQAFHWFANEKALAEIYRVLRANGRLGLIWNVRDESEDWVAAITDIITPYEGDTPRFHTGSWQLPFTGNYFSTPELTCFRYTHSGSAREVIMDRFLSVSFIAALPAAEKAKVSDQLQHLIDTHPSLRGRETIDFPYQTQAYLCRRLD
ncbi:MULTISPECIES: class I SAM-dependent methyltransferase [Pseudomonas]|uniref:SAM-dependent methyltransferase n=1 Tax=Pseudomonas fluorescens TaxID=294 RepID=A0A0N9X0G1_PSEFL|nr:MULTISPECIES: class I SAM-dependent methyltransferase [Pseudomonas]ALI09134.1 SAM-dependent methyltransferase [Pseudomonas fluorescens]POA11082.1 methyltransferase domain-containing protein [Pseudomonas sp. MPBD7-1]